jgi:hypothetical protein
MGEDFVVFVGGVALRRYGRCLKGKGVKARAGERNGS